ncbi:hypothetical protein NCC78_31675, partial [Micromonospora phytophila]|uniref:hypothetical protein n=1 Tax=Micromonospora phytophila TaxID=709888 RepID=UPI00202FC353
MTVTSHYPERVAAVRAHAAAGDSAALVDELVEVARLNGGHWGYDGRAVTDVLDALPVDDRRHLALALLDRPDVEDPADTGRSLRGLLSIVVRHLGTVMPVADARRLL